jgi:hypothetical protein
MYQGLLFICARLWSRVPSIWRRIARGVNGKGAMKADGKHSGDHLSRPDSELKLVALE